MTDKPNQQWPVTVLQNHPDVTIIVDERADKLLKD
jgi:6-phosphogluconolactonase/glucosamine-6-phosphate isomerase/deaminase